MTSRLQLWVPQCGINARKEECKTFEAGFESMQQDFKETLDQLADYLVRV